MNIRLADLLKDTQNRVAFGFLIGGAFLLLCSFLDPEWKGFFSFVASMIKNPSEMAPASAMVLGSILTVGAVVFGSPFFLPWLHASRPLRIVLRFLASAPPLIMIFLSIQFGGFDEPIILFLIFSPLCTAIGLFTLKPAAHELPES